MAASQSLSQGEFMWIYGPWSEIQGGLEVVQNSELTLLDSSQCTRRVLQNTPPRAWGITSSSSSLTFLQQNEDLTRWNK